MQDMNFVVTGMTCSACSAHVERAVSKLVGVDSVAVNLMTGAMRVSAEGINEQDIIDAVIREGYGCEKADAGARSEREKHRSEEVKKKKRSLILSFVFLLPLFYLGMGHMMGLPIPHAFQENALLYGLVQLLFLLPILWLNRHYFTVGFSRLFRLSPNMDSLVALGAAAGIVYSLIAMLRINNAMPEYYFESAGMILTLVSVGKYMEQRSNLKTTEAVSELLALAPRSAVRKLADGTEETVAVEELAVGDTVILRQGSRIPVDGMLSAGEAAVDESALTGESLPAEKHSGDALSAGTVVRFGYAEMQVQRVGGDTTLAQIVRLMEEAASTKAPISKLADRVSLIFVPTVIGIALISALLWYFIGDMGLHFSLSIGIAVLVISCPCALGLATPVAIMVGTGKAAQQGILIKSAESVELLGKVDTVVLDKTGTVTAGEMALTDILPAEDISKAELLTLAASLEQPSEHPLALAIIRAAKERGIAAQAVSDYHATAGGGVSAELNGKTLYGGNLRFMEQLSLKDGFLFSAAESFAAEGKTPLFFAENEKLLGVLAIADSIRPTSKAAMEAFRSLGLDLVLLTGDNRHTAKTIAAELGIENIYAEVLPQDKQRIVQDLQRKGKKVAMIGDGVNDAPALAAADVGLAIGAGTDIAVESADVVLMKSDLMSAARAVELSRATIRKVRQNLFWAFFYNAIGIPIAAGALYSAFAFKLNPMLGAAAMSFSSVSVVSNALSLRRFQSRFPSDVNKEPVHTNIETKEKTSMKLVHIEGMMCPHCRDHVEKALNALEGVSATVDLTANTASVTGDVSDDAIRKAVTDAGYSVTGIE